MAEKLIMHGNEKNEKETVWREQNPDQPVAYKFIHGKNVAPWDLLYDSYDDLGNLKKTDVNAPTFQSTDKYRLDNPDNVHDFRKNKDQRSGWDLTELENSIKEDVSSEDKVSETTINNPQNAEHGTSEDFIGPLPNNKTQESSIEKSVEKPVSEHQAGLQKLKDAGIGNVFEGKDGRLYASYNETAKGNMLSPADIKFALKAIERGDQEDIDYIKNIWADKVWTKKEPAEEKLERLEQLEQFDKDYANKYEDRPAKSKTYLLNKDEALNAEAALGDIEHVENPKIGFADKFKNFWINARKSGGKFVDKVNEVFYGYDYTDGPRLDGAYTSTGFNRAQNFIHEFGNNPKARRNLMLFGIGVVAVLRAMPAFAGAFENMNTENIPIDDGNADMESGGQIDIPEDNITPEHENITPHEGYIDPNGYEHFSVGGYSNEFDSYFNEGKESLHAMGAYNPDVKLWDLHNDTLTNESMKSLSNNPAAAVDWMMKTEYKDLPNWVQSTEDANKYILDLKADPEQYDKVMNDFCNEFSGKVDRWLVVDIDGPYSSSYQYGDDGWLAHSNYVGGERGGSLYIPLDENGNNLLAPNGAGDNIKFVTDPDSGKEIPAIGARDKCSDILQQIGALHKTPGPNAVPEPGEEVPPPIPEIPVIPPVLPPENPEPKPEPTPEPGPDPKVESEIQEDHENIPEEETIVNENPASPDNPNGLTNPIMPGDEVVESIDGTPLDNQVKPSLPPSEQPSVPGAPTYEEMYEGRENDNLVDHNGNPINSDEIVTGGETPKI